MPSVPRFFRRLAVTLCYPCGVTPRRSYLLRVLDCSDPTKAANEFTTHPILAIDHDDAMSRAMAYLKKEGHKVRTISHSKQPMELLGYVICDRFTMGRIPGRFTPKEIAKYTTKTKADLYPGARHVAKSRLT